MSDLRPTGITADRQSGSLAVEWSDGHTSVYPFSLVRLACPCAQCRGGHEYMRSDPDPEVFAQPVEDSPRTRMEKIEAVGTYGLMIEWQDGHHYGIYNWNYLRKLCPCPECRGNESHGGA
jgi:DUF971 family protein